MVYLVTLFSVLAHGCYIGSRLVSSLFALHLGANPFEVGVLAGLYALLSLLLAIEAGKACDRHGPVRLMILGAVLGTLALLIAYAFESMNALYVCAIVSGAGFIFFNVSVQSLVALMSTSQNRARNFSILSQGYSVSTLVAPLIGGFAIQYLGSVNTYLVFALLAGIPALALPFMRGLARLKAAGAGETARSSVTELLRDKPLRTSFITSGLVVTGWDLFTFYLPVYGHEIGLSPVAIGMVLGIFGAAAFCVRYFLPPLVARLTETGLLGWAMAIAAVLFVIFPFFENVYALCVLSVGLGMTLGLGQPLSMMITYSRSPAARAGEANGVRLMVNHFTHFIVPIASGAIGTALGVGPVFWINAICLGFAAKVLRKSRS
jgi:MFS family permease